MTKDLPDTTMLPGHPLLRPRHIIGIGERELVFRIVVSRQVEQNGSALEHGKVVAIMINDSGDAAIRVDLEVPGFLLHVVGDILEGCQPVV